jgi:hypothetical protein
MGSLINKEKNLVYNQSEILKEFESFYETLYSAMEVTDVNLYDILHDVTKLSQEDSSSFEGPLTYQEAHNALKKMTNNKSPGSDGFTVEFFKCFFIDIGTLLVRSANEGFVNNKLSATQRQGVIVCIPKEKPKQCLKNWRPISLLNTAYKIVSASISNRLKSVLSNIIHEDQKGF